MQTPLPHQFRQQRPFPISLQIPPARPPSPSPKAGTPTSKVEPNSRRYSPVDFYLPHSPQCGPLPRFPTDDPLPRFHRRPPSTVPRRELPSTRARSPLSRGCCLPATLSVFIFLHLPLLHFSPSLLHFLQGTQPPSMSCQTHPFARSSLRASTSSPALPRYPPSGTGRGAQGAGATRGFGSHSARTRSCTPPPPLTVS